ncbi:hypothetical protein BKA62DRAFT_699295 [Auriculariales sp. MPI-PUGE-AT-0066]|nr:hypothetical protein BKA62DRAFT_699295 [Auriculariales sp. MPI-PUGE-AT-0066]
MSVDRGDVDPLVPVLRTVVGTVLPVATVLITVAFSTRTDDGQSFGDIITDEDIEEERARDAARANAPVATSTSEQTPLLGAHREGPRRDSKSWVFAQVGAYELGFSITTLVINLLHGGAIATPALSILIWTYGTALPLLSPTRGPAYPLFFLYIFTLAAAVLDLYIIPHGIITNVGYILHVAACFIGLLVILNTPVRPPQDGSLKNDESTTLGLDEYATLGQWLSVSWMNPLFVRARAGALNNSDMFRLVVENRAGVLARKFLPFMHGKKLLRRIVFANWGTLLIAIVSVTISGALGSIQPMIVHRILSAIEGATASEGAIDLQSSDAGSRDLGLLALIFAPMEVSSRDTRTAYLFTVLAFLTMVLQAQLWTVFAMFTRRFEIRARAEAVSTIYAKALVRIDTSGVVVDDAASDNDGSAPAGKADMGKVVSLVSTDVGEVHSLPYIFDSITEGIVNVGLLSWFLFKLLGISAIAGYVLFFAVAPFTAYMTRTYMAQFRKVANQRDIRTRAINELLQSIKFIKFSAWETQWTQRILKLREIELAQLFTARIVVEIFNMTWQIVPILIASINLTCYTVVFGHQLTVSIAFPAIIAMSSLAFELNNIPNKFGQYANMTAAYQRIDEFLEEEEVRSWASALKQDRPIRGQEFDTRLGAANATFQWYKYTPKPDEDEEQDAKPAARWYQRPFGMFRKGTASTQAEEPAVAQEDQTFQLRGINVVFPRGQLSVVTGPTGSGKSSLLSALLGEMDCLAGTVMLPKMGHHVNSETGLVEGISLCSQHPWLESKTIKENILFGSLYDEERYNAVLDACALTPDLQQMEGGDSTEIGDKGIVLSGGQKARVALARAVYARTQTVLLDDVLSAVDTHTAATLIKKCLFGPLMQGRTIVLVTHHFNTVISAGASWVVRVENGTIKIQGSPEHLRHTGDLAAISKAEAAEEHRQDKLVEEDEKNVQQAKAKIADEKKATKLVEEETKASGAVSASIYAVYLRATSYWVIALFAFAIIVRESGTLVQKFWIKIWTESYDQPTGWRNVLGFPSASESVVPYVLVYLGLQLSIVLLMVGVAVASIWTSLRAARILFTRMLDSVIRAPTRFFDKTPAGRILNRFTKDIGSVDGTVSTGMRYSAGIFFAFLVSIGSVAYAIPAAIIPLIPLVALHLYVARGYITAGRDLGRLQSTTYSPVITLFSEMIQGITTIRAFNGETRFSESMYTLLDKYHWANYCKEACESWLSYRFEVLGSTTFLISVILAIYFDLSPGLAAIVLTQSQGVFTSLQFGMTMYVNMENGMNSVERVQEYIELESEPPRRVKSLPAAWPLLGEGITFRDVVLRYAPELEPVLRGVSFHVKASEKIGIVGRTGSGKSTLAMSLFRFVDPDEGSISVGGKDITEVGVEDLREHLTLIPQDAALYSGTIRENLDPFKLHTDADCLEALRMVQLPVSASGAATPAQEGDNAESVQTQKVVTLDSKVSDGGANWSAGQRQLIAMARALLRNSGIIVLDESTASVDFETDKKIQSTIREQFKGSILLTIAHRLHTIIDYDRILVLDQGKVAEFDTPAALITKEHGVFRGICKQSGHFDELKRAAQEKALIII